MLEIIVKNQDIDDLLDQLNDFLQGEISEKFGERVLSFDNTFGEGIIRSISFDWGVSLIDYDVCFKENIEIVHATGEESPVEFLFITEGKLGYLQDDYSEELLLERYQNIIISPDQCSKKTYRFIKMEHIKVNIIHILKNQYAKKKHNNLRYLNDVISSVFIKDSAILPYQHFGNYNLKIADQVKEIRTVVEEGSPIQPLGIEGRLNIILAMQLWEHHRYETEDTLPESLSVIDIKKIHNLAAFITDAIAEPLTIAMLSAESGLSAKKLQLGFRMLYGKSVNEYIKKLKLEISRDYLKNTNLSVSEVVYKIGIKSRSYFSKIFSEHYGLLPTEYRQKLRNRIRE